jgi:hypothetical protein
MGKRINAWIMAVAALLVLGGLLFSTNIEQRAPHEPHPDSGQIFRIGGMKTTGGARYVTAVERRNRYICWGVMLIGIVVITAVQKGALDFSNNGYE